MMMINNNLITNKWLQFKFYLENKILSKYLIISAFNQFNTEILYNLTENQTVTIIFRVKSNNEFYRNISNIQFLTKDNYNEILENFIEFWDIKDNEYLTYSINEIIFSYKIIEINKSKNIQNLIFLNIKKSKSNSYLLKLGGYNFPSTMDLTKWGEVIYYNNDKNAMVYKNKSNAVYHIEFINSKTMYVQYKFKDKKLLEFTDTLMDSSNLENFKRTFKNTSYSFNNGNIISKTKLYKFNKINPLKKQSFLINKFITLDIETKVIDNVIIPYALSYYDGKITRSFYETDFIDTKEMIKTAIKSLLLRKYHNYKVFVHNLSNFDGIFLFETLMEVSDKVIPIINDRKFVNITLKYNDKYKIHFRDSYLMLPSSLDKLSKSFNVENKTLFPYNFVNNYRIYSNYNGEVPDITFFNGISTPVYDKYCELFKNKKWNLKNETIKYCNQDVISLYQVLESFFKQNFVQTRVNASNYVSLPSLTLANYRTKFMSNNNISVITGEVFKFIKQAYTGGSVDVYKPYGKNIFRYDVNSLYPYIMKTNPMPIGNPTLIESDHNTIELIIKDKTKFSFVELDVDCPLNLNIPLLLTRYKSSINYGYRSIAPVGNWSGVYTSIEINRALELGYKFRYKKAIYFNAEIIFKDYVDYYYDMKKNSIQNSSNYTISKLMLNSLYGRFGMNPYLPKHMILNENAHLNFIDKFNIIDVYPLNNGKELVTYEDFNLIQSNDDSNTLVNISIAAAITAGARVFMSYFKNMNNYKVYYSDTDSIDLDQPLDSNYVGSELGKMKLEHVFNEAVYLAPKMYGGKTDNYEYIKIKGLKNPIPYKELTSLVKKGNSLIKPNQKWYKSLSKANITIKDEIYRLSVTDNKRLLIFDSNNNFIDTKPIKL